MDNSNLTPFEGIGGSDKLEKLVTAFYTRVGKDPLLSPIFPDNLTETAQKQKKFLTQYLGGPQLYTDEYGHPMLRARHLPFEITPTRAKRWLELMDEAMDEIGMSGPLRKEFFSRLVLTAQHMINTADTDEGKGESQ
jgi:hemoglobin